MQQYACPFSHLYFQTLMERLNPKPQNLSLDILENHLIRYTDNKSMRNIFSGRKKFSQTFELTL
jgi:hypothetical protein